MLPDERLSDTEALGDTFSVRIHNGDPTTASVLRNGESLDDVVRLTLDIAPGRLLDLYVERLMHEAIVTDTATVDLEYAGARVSDVDARALLLALQDEIIRRLTEKWGVERLMAGAAAGEALVALSDSPLASALFKGAHRLCTKYPVT